MSLRFILGRAGSGKTTKCIEEIRQSLREKPDGNPIIYLVPDQMTFLSEYQLISTPDLGGMIRAQTFSFSRLAWRILQETGGTSRYHLNSVGVSMLIRKIMDEQKDSFKLFSRAADKNGFVQHMEQMLTELKRYCVTPQELDHKREQIAGAGQKQSALADKLHDLKLIYEDFEDGLAGKYVDSEDYFRLLSENVAKSSYLRNAEIYVDGFHSFTPQEYIVLAQLMKHTKKVTVALTVEAMDRNLVGDWHLFRMTNETLETLCEMAKIEGVTIEEKKNLKDSVRFQTTPALAHMEAYFDRRPLHVFNNPDLTNIHIGQAVNRRAEIEGIARHIKRLVREQDYRYRYRDIAVLLRNGNSYDELIETVFNDYEIPYFIDQKRTMLNHPFIELIRSTLEILNSKWRYEPVFRAVKTDLLFTLDSDRKKMREDMDQLENYVLAYGIQGDKWTKKDRWTYRRIRGLELEQTPQTDREKQIEQRYNELRLIITAPILRLSRRLKKAQTGQQLCEALFLYVEELDIPMKLETLKLIAEEKGSLVKAREHDQAWNAVVDLLDQFVEILGEESLTLEQFASILEAGFESMKFSIVPPALDQVLIGDLEKSRLSDIKAAFVIGLNEGVMPAKISDEGILADNDREQLANSGLKIAASSKIRLIDEEFIAYKAFTTPGQLLFVTYPLANEEGKALMPSSYIKRIKEMFPHAKEHFFLNEPSELPEAEQLQYVDSEKTTISYLTAQLSLMKRNYPIYDFWWDVYNHYITQPKWADDATHILSSLFYENKAKVLSQDVSKELYGDTIQASVSRMERFHGCPFSHFASHGLKLRERPIYRLEAPDIGEMFHGALKYIADELMNIGRTWASLSKEECLTLSKQAVQLLAPKLQHQILLSSNRHYYILRKLENVVSRATLILSEHGKASGFSPVGLEVGFGPKEKIPALSFTLKNGTQMELVGRIDRVDRADGDKGTYLRVIDYKSSSKEINLNEVYYGLALQMLTYLDIVVANSKELIGSPALPAGILYFHVHNPIVKSNRMLSLDEIEDEIFKSFKMKGLLLGDSDVIKLMDNTLDSGESKIVSAGIKKDGTLSSRSKVASDEEFLTLRSYVRNLYQKTGEQIASGTADITPYKLKDRTPCTFCSYKSVCQFDPVIEDNQYRSLQSLERDDILNLMREEARVDEDNDSNEAN